jgi:hypothetical protein
VLNENIQKEGNSEAAAAARTTRTAVPWRRTARREGERARTGTKEERGKHTVFDRILSSTRRRAAFNTSGGPTTHVRVKEAAKVSEMCGYACQRCAGRTGKVEKRKESR